MPADLHTRLLAELDTWSDDNGRMTPPEAALRALVELHAPFQRSTLSLGCRACSTPVHTQPGRYVTVVPWPCSTIQAIADQFGLTTDGTP